MIDQVKDASETAKDLLESIADFNAIKDAKEEKIQTIKMQEMPVQEWLILITILFLPVMK